MVSANCSTSSSRPRVLMVSWYTWPRAMGGWPICPAATWVFCASMARTTSPADSFFDASLSGFSHSLML
jgi:hypothetical protein